MSLYVDGPSPLKRFATTVIPPAIVVPGALLLGVTVLYRFHRFWRWIRIGRLWANPDNFVQLAAGAGVNLLFGDKVPIRVAALMVWIPSRVVACLDEYHKLAKAYQKWVEAIRGDFPRTPNVRWVKANKKNRVMTPSDELWWRTAAITLRIRVQRIAVRTYKLVKRMFVLSMVCVDAVEALSLKKSSCDRAVNEFFLDATNALDRIARQREDVQSKLEANRPLANKLLKKLGTRYTADRLISGLSTAMEGIEVVDKGVKEVTNFGNGIAKDMLKHAVFGVFSVMGIPDKIPVQWMPGQWEKDHFERAPIQQYIPTEHVMQPSIAQHLGPAIHEKHKIAIHVPRRPVKDPRAVELGRPARCQLDVQVGG